MAQAGCTLIIILKHPTICKTMSAERPSGFWYWVVIAVMVATFTLIPTLITLILIF
jgi:hypothetical protein